MKEKKNKGIGKLLKLIHENPELPVVPMVCGEVVGGDDGNLYFAGSIGEARVDEYLIPDKNRFDDGIYFKSDDDVFGVLEHYLPEEEWNALPDYESVCRKYYDALPWVKAIIVYIELPDSE